MFWPLAPWAAKCRDTSAASAVLAAECEKVEVFQAAEATLSRRPQCAVLLDAKAVYTAFAQSVGGCIRRSDFTVGEMLNASIVESQPQAASHGVCRQGLCILFMSQAGPWSFLHDSVAR